MSLTIIGDVILDGTLASPCDRASEASPRARGIIVPPKMAITDHALARTVSLSLLRSVDVAQRSSNSLALGGDFNNYSTVAHCFDWESGGLTLDGSAEQAFEVAGRDLGPSFDGFESNFAMGTVEVASGRRVRFADDFDNDGVGQEGCTEALYVHELILRAGATITIANCRVYYETLIDEGASVAFEGCGDLVQLPTGDFDHNGRVDLYDWQAFTTCLGGPSGVSMDAGCEVFDFDAQGTVDLADLAWFQTAFTGP